jgi:hypothetical protein
MQTIQYFRLVVRNLLVAEPFLHLRFRHGALHQGFCPATVCVCAHYDARQTSMRCDVGTRLMTDFKPLTLISK